MRVIRIFLFLLPTLVSIPTIGQKVDKIYLNNGDVITCEVKYLENNLLFVKTDHSGNFNIEWDKIDSLRIKKFLRIELKNGMIYFGSLLPSDTAQKDILAHVGGIEELDHMEIVAMVASKDRFLDRFDGSVSTGLSYTKASKVGQINFSGDAKYQGPKYQLELKYSNIYSRTGGEEPDQNQFGSFILERSLPKKWFVFSALSLESNTELDLRLRSNFALGGGNNLVHTNFIVFGIATGAQFNREISSENSQYNVEGILQTKLSIFRYDSPKINFTIGGKLIPSFSNWGRIRTEFDSKLRWEILNDFYISWTLGHRFDSKPLSSNAEKIDYWIVFGLEYSF